MAELDVSKSTEIRTLQDVDTDEPFYPLTHERAIIDDNGEEVIPKIKEEINGLKVAYDGTVYDSAGEAVRGQIGKLSDEIISSLKNNTMNIIDFMERESVTRNGVAFDFVDGGCYIVGVASEWTFANIGYYQDKIPKWLELGKMHHVELTKLENTGLQIMYFKDNALYNTLSLTETCDVRIPSDITGIVFRVVANGGYEYNGLFKFKITNAVTNNELFDYIVDYNSVDFLPMNASYKNKSGDVSFTWNEDNTKCSVIGTTESSSFNNIYYNENELPKGLKAGNSYTFKYKSTDSKVYIRVYYFVDGTITLNEYITNGVMTIPENCEGMAIRLYVNAGTYDAIVSDIHIFYGLSNRELGEKINEIKENINDDLLPMFGNYTNLVINGLEYKWIDDTSMSVVGVGTGSNIYRFYGNDSKLPDVIEKGKFYYVTADSSDTNIHPYIHVYKTIKHITSNGAEENSKTYSRIYITEPMYVFIPEDCEGMIFGVTVFDGISVNGVISNIHFYKSKPNEVATMDKFSDRKRILVSFSDDDTIDEKSVNRYYQNCRHNGIRGSYGVITDNINDGLVNAETLLQYEREGFGIYIHCHRQFNYWRPYELTDEDMEQCIENLGTGISDMARYGFSNYKIWFTPTGNYNEQYKKMARMFNLECLVCQRETHNRVTDVDRYEIGRFGLYDTDENTSHSMQSLKQKIDRLVIEGGGWLDIITHFNLWEETNTWDDTLDDNGYPIGYSRFNEIVEYARSKGCEIVSFSEAYSYYKNGYIN